MFKQSERLTRSQFSVYFKTGRRHSFLYGTVVYTPLTHLHASVVVSKKVAKRAVARNRLRRRVYGQVYRTCKQSGYTGVFIVLLKPSAATATQAELAASVAHVVATVAQKA